MVDSDLAGGRLVDDRFLTDRYLADMDLFVQLVQASCAAWRERTLIPMMRRSPAAATAANLPSPGPWRCKPYAPLNPVHHAPGLRRSSLQRWLVERHRHPR